MRSVKLYDLYSYATKWSVVNQSLTSCHHLRQDMPMSEKEVWAIPDGQSEQMIIYSLKIMSQNVGPQETLRCMVM